MILFLRISFSPLCLKSAKARYVLKILVREIFCYNKTEVVVIKIIKSVQKMANLAHVYGMNLLKIVLILSSMWQSIYHVTNIMLIQ